MLQVTQVLMYTKLWWNGRAHCLCHSGNLLPSLHGASWLIQVSYIYVRSPALPCSQGVLPLLASFAHIHDEDASHLPFILQMYVIVSLVAFADVICSSWLCFKLLKNKVQATMGRCLLSTGTCST